MKLEGFKLTPLQAFSDKLNDKFPFYLDSCSRQS